MTIYRGVSGVNREIKQQFRGVGGVNREIKEQYRGVGGVNRLVFSHNGGEIYDSGVEYVDLESYYIEGSGAVQFGTTNIQCVAAPGSNVTIFGSAEKIDLTAFSKLKVTCTQNNGSCVFGLANNKGSSFFSAPVAKTDVGYPILTATTYELGVSAYSGLYYFAMRTSTGNTAVITKIWLE